MRIMTKANLKAGAITALVAGASIVPALVFGQDNTLSPQPLVTSVGGVYDLLCRIIDVLFTLLVILAVAFVVFAAFKYLTAGGDPEKVKTANHVVIYAAVAVVVALLAKSVPLIVGSFLGAGA